MHANVIRVYTILMPEFYEALAAYNASAKQPLYFMQGVYNNEEDISNLCDAYAKNGKIARDWVEMCQTIVDVVHGNAEIKPEAGNASGTYTADVSQYLCGWILGIEWQADFVIHTNKNNADKKSFEGNYLYTEDASPFEVFLASGLDACISYETENYSMQHPTAFANWVTTDPLDHPGEPNPEMEDAVPVDAEHIKAKPEFKAGLFASYHVYPYYPEMMRYAPELLAENPPNPYRHYLTDLNAYHTMPVIVSEFGVPASRGITHYAHDAGFNQGGLNEEEQGNAIVSMLSDIVDSGCAGACVFIWQDEWFKRTWNTMDYTDAEVGPYWCDVQTSDQFFGLLSFDPGEKPVCIVDGDAAEWGGEQPLAVSEGTELYVKNDEAYIYLMIRGKNDNVRIAIDTIKEQGNEEYNGADFALENPGGVGAGAHGARVTVHGAAAVGLLQPGGPVALHHALIALALAGAGDVHPVPGGEHVGLNLVAHVEGVAVGQAELLEGLLAGVPRLFQVAQLGAGELALRHVAVAQLYGAVAVLLCGLFLHHGAGARRDDGDRDDLTGFVEDLRHADLLADNGLFHVCSSL